MRSNLPKVLHPLASEPILSHVIATANALLAVHGGTITVVTGHGRDQVDPLVHQLGCGVAHQTEQLGTGHALQIALQDADPSTLTLVLYGDVPLIRAEHLQPLLEQGRHHLAVMTAILDDPTGYGRICRDANGQVVAIVEHKDATADQLTLHEINSGIYAGPTALFQRLLPQLSNQNAQKEYYLTDCVALSVGANLPVMGVTGPQEAVLGINDREQLAAMESSMQDRYRAALMRSGVTLVDPATVYIRGSVQIEADVTIEPNVMIYGTAVIGQGVHIGFGCHLTDVQIAEGVVLKPYSVLESVTVGAGAAIGPFARLRPGTVLGADTHIGNFVETKNTTLGAHSKVNHLSYVGDATVGTRVNIGAGTITCNYDGAHKHPTVLGDDVFIGSNTSLVAPVTLGDGVTTGAGSVITNDVPTGQLAISRSAQQNKSGYQRPTKTKE